MVKSIKILLLVFLATFAFTEATHAQALSVANGTIGFHALEKKDVKAEHSSFTSSIDLVAKTVSFQVPIEEFKFKIGLMKNHFLAESVMNAANFPAATFDGSIVANTDLTQDGLHDVQAEGKMTILETTLDISVNGIIEVANGLPHLKANFMVNGKEYGLDSKKVEKFADQIEVRVDVNYQ